MKSLTASNLSMLGMILVACLPAALSLLSHQHQPNYPIELQLQRSSSTQLYSGNFADRLRRYGGFPEEDQQEQPSLSWDYDEDDFGNNPQQQQQQQASNALEINSEDDLPSQDIEGAEITQDFKEKVKASHNEEKEESSQGGSKFRELMAKAKQSAASAVPELQQQQQQPMYSNPQIPSDPLDLSIEEQARLFRELMMERQQQQYNQQMNPDTQQPQHQQQQQVYNNQQQNPYAQQQQQMNQNPYDQQQSYNQMQPPMAQQYPYPQQQQQPQRNYREYGTAFDGRRIGRNKDADAVSNSADVYFAQLKRDSTSRNYARYAGDNEKANEVFWDPTIHEIEAPENPYRLEQLEREKQMYETVPEEMLLFQEYGKEEEEVAPRLSYKDRLAQRQAERAQRRQSSPQQQQWAPQQHHQPQSPQEWTPQQEEQQSSPQQWSPPTQQTPPRWSPQPQSWQQQQQQQGDGNPPPFELY